MGSDGDDGFRRALTRRIAQLGSQADDVHVDGACFDFLGTDAPKARQQFFARDGTRLVSDKKTQDRDLGLG